MDFKTDAYGNVLCYTKSVLLNKYLRYIYSHKKHMKEITKDCCKNCGYTSTTDMVKWHGDACKNMINKKTSNHRSKIG